MPLLRGTAGLGAASRVIQLGGAPDGSEEHARA